MSYQNPFEILNISPTLSAAERKMVRKRILAEFEMTDDSVAFFSGQAFDKATILAFLEELEDPIASAGHAAILRIPGMSGFLTFGEWYDLNPADMQPPGLEPSVLAFVHEHLREKLVGELVACMYVHDAARPMRLRDYVMALPEALQDEIWREVLRNANQRTLTWRDTDLDLLIRVQELSATFTQGLAWVMNALPFSHNSIRNITARDTINLFANLDRHIPEKAVEHHDVIALVAQIHADKENVRILRQHYDIFNSKSTAKKPVLPTKRLWVCPFDLFGLKYDKPIDHPAALAKMRGVIDNHIAQNTRQIAYQDQHVSIETLQKLALKMQDLRMLKRYQWVANYPKIKAFLNDCHPDKLAKMRWSTLIPQTDAAGWIAAHLTNRVMDIVGHAVPRKMYPFLQFLNTKRQRWKVIDFEFALLPLQLFFHKIRYEDLNRDLYLSYTARRQKPPKVCLLAVINSLQAPLSPYKQKVFTVILEHIEANKDSMVDNEILVALDFLQYMTVPRALQKRRTLLDKELTKTDKLPGWWGRATGAQKAALIFLIVFFSLLGITLLIQNTMPSSDPYAGIQYSAPPIKKSPKKIKLPPEEAWAKASNHYELERPQTGDSPFEVFYENQFVYDQNAVVELVNETPVDLLFMFLRKEKWEGIVRNHLVRNGEKYRAAGIPIGKYEISCKQFNGDLQPAEGQFPVVMDIQKGESHSIIVRPFDLFVDEQPPSESEP